jgi:allantoate deiminase
MRKRAAAIAKRRGLKMIWVLVQETTAVQCDNALRRIFSECIAQRGLKVIKLPSGAGHDAGTLSTICPVAMLFVRCKGGISHNPAESLKTTDAQMAIGVLADFIRTLAKAG